MGEGARAGGAVGRGGVVEGVGGRQEMEQAYEEQEMGEEAGAVCRKRSRIRKRSGAGGSEGGARRAGEELQCV